jgi:uncharacterized Zn ribbon protein
MKIPKCSKHPRYKAKRPPTAVCSECVVQWHMTSNAAKRLDDKILKLLNSSYLGMDGDVPVIDEYCVHCVAELLQEKRELYL